MLLFSLQAELAVHLQSVMVRYLTFLEREKIAAYFVITDFGKCLPQRVALRQRGDAPEGQQIPVSNAASLGGGGTFLWAQGGSWRARNEEEEGGGGTHPCVLLQAEIHVFQLYCATVLSGIWTACLGHRRVT